MDKIKEIKVLHTDTEVNKYLEDDWVLLRIFNIDNFVLCRYENKSDVSKLDTIAVYDDYLDEYIDKETPYIPTCELVEILRKREGVEATQLPPHANATFTIDGPAIVLNVID